MKKEQSGTSPFAMMRLLSLSRIAPILTGIIGHQIFGQAFFGVVAGFILTVAISLYLVTRPNLQRQWQLLIVIPVLLWGIGIIWYAATRL